MCPQYYYYKAFFPTKICALLHRRFSRKFFNAACCTFNILEVRTITPNRFKNQSTGTLKILAHNCNHQQGLVKKIVALHHPGFKAEFPKHFYEDGYFW